jgi:cytochrome c oxidase assembly factor CtaG
MQHLLPILLHPGQPLPTGDIWSLWTWDPTVLVGCAALVGCYVWLLRGWLSPRFYLFFAGVLVLMLALVSPLDTLADHYLFSAHMLQHLLLILVVPPLLLLGTPASLFTSVLRNPVVARLERVLRQPVLAWTLGVGMLYVWHAPAFYNAALANEQVHVVQHLCFLVTATIFWWPVLSPVESSRTSLLMAVPYLLAAAMANSLLGIYFSFAAPGLYPAYLNPSTNLSVLAVIRDGWGLSAAADQQLGGLLMWVPGGLVFLGAVFAVLARWYAAADSDEPMDELSKGVQGEHSTGSLGVSPNVLPHSQID